MIKDNCFKTAINNLLFNWMQSISFNFFVNFIIYYNSLVFWKMVFKIPLISCFINKFVFVISYLFAIQFKSYQKKLIYQSFFDNIKQLNNKK